MADQRRTRGSARAGSSRPRGRTGPGRGGAARPVRPAGEPGTGAAPRVRPKLTGRAAVLVLVLAVLTLSYTSSLRAYLQQRDHIESLKQQIAEREQAIDELEDEKARWEDPAFVEQQARERFGYVMPGETSYIALDENGDRIQSEVELSDPTQVGDTTPKAWWDSAWESVELAGNPPRSKGPATEIKTEQRRTQE